MRASRFTEPLLSCELTEDDRALAQPLMVEDTDERAEGRDSKALLKLL